MHLARFGLLFQTWGQLGGLSQQPVRRFEQNCPAIGTALSLVELGHYWLGENIGELQTFCCAMLG
jgi:hypothetical protein